MVKSRGTLRKRMRKISIEQKMVATVRNSRVLFIENNG
jgi:hypothetical protein